jgi:hypothetical protein
MRCSGRLKWSSAGRLKCCVKPLLKATFARAQITLVVRHQGAVVKHRPRRVVDLGADVEVRYRPGVALGLQEHRVGRLQEIARAVLRHQVAVIGADVGGHVGRSAVVARLPLDLGLLNLGALAWVGMLGFTQSDMQLPNETIEFHMKPRMAPVITSLGAPGNSVASSSFSLPARHCSLS